MRIDAMRRIGTVAAMAAIVVFALGGEIGRAHV